MDSRTGLNESFDSLIQIITGKSGPDLKTDKTIRITVDDVFSPGPNPLRDDIRRRAESRHSIQQFDFLQELYDANKELQALLEQKNQGPEVQVQLADLKEKLKEIAAKYVDPGVEPKKSSFEMTMEEFKALEDDKEVNIPDEARAPLSRKNRMEIKLSDFKLAFEVVFKEAMKVTNLSVGSEMQGGAGTEATKAGLIGKYEELQQLKAEREQRQQFVTKLSKGIEALVDIQKELQGLEKAQAEAAKRKSFLAKVGHSVSSTLGTRDSVKMQKLIDVMEKAKSDLQGLLRNPGRDPADARRLLDQVDGRSKMAVLLMAKEQLALQKGAKFTMGSEFSDRITAVAEGFTGVVGVKSEEKASARSIVISSPTSTSRSRSGAVSVSSPSSGSVSSDSDVAPEVDKSKVKMSEWGEQKRAEEPADWQADIDTYRAARQKSRGPH